MKPEKPKCSVGECLAKELARGLCSKHYFRLRNHGDVNAASRMRGEGSTHALRFWSRTALTANPEKCWLWLGTVGTEGYGRIVVPNVGECGTHRYAYYLFNGRWPDPQCLHTCDVRLCVNPHHLWEGTQRDNMLDMVAKGRHGNKRGRITMADAVDFIQESGESIR